MRWKLLLEFSCRNRLLLSGTPIQNSMAELWALLHFIMPTMFDSHDEFNEWFSKDIESHAENKASIDESMEHTSWNLYFEKLINIFSFLHLQLEWYIDMEAYADRWWSLKVSSTVFPSFSVRQLVSPKMDIFNGFKRRKNKVANLHNCH